MLTLDLIRTTKKPGRLYARTLSDAERVRFLPIAEAMIQIAKASIGLQRYTLSEGLDAVHAEARDRKILLGLKKLITDRCVFKSLDDIDMVSFRRKLYLEASTRRMSSPDDQPFDARLFLQDYQEAVDIAEQHHVDLNEALYADLKRHHRLDRFDSLSPSALLDVYDCAQHQAILLRATKVELEMLDHHASVYRALFAKLKFRRLLYTCEKINQGYRFRIDGPMNLFRSGTKYGLQLALLMPFLESLPNWHLEAEILWGKEKKRYRYTHMASYSNAQDQSSAGSDAVNIPDLLLPIVKRFGGGWKGWTVHVSEHIFDVPGLGAVVPDLYFIHDQIKTPIYLELMGFWSRDAVWQRIDMVRSGLDSPLIFAVSERLRVSEAVLGDTSHASLYVYKGSLNANELVRCLEKVSGALHCTQSGHLE